MGIFSFVVSSTDAAANEAANPIPGHQNGSSRSSPAERFNGICAHNALEGGILVNLRDNAVSQILTLEGNGVAKITSARLAQVYTRLAGNDLHEG